MSNDNEYAEDLRIIESATDGDWKVVELENGCEFELISDYWYIATICDAAGNASGKDNATYLKRFQPSYTKQLVEKAMKCDALAQRVKELEAAVVRVTRRREDGGFIVSAVDLDELEERLNG